MKGYEKVTKDNIEVGMEVFVSATENRKAFESKVVDFSDKEVCTKNSYGEYIIFGWGDSELLCEGKIIKDIAKLREEFKDRVEMIDPGRSFSEIMYIATALVGVENTLNHLEDLADGTTVGHLRYLLHPKEHLEAIEWDVVERFDKLIEQLST